MAFLEELLKTPGNLKPNNRKSCCVTMIIKGGEGPGVMVLSFNPSTPEAEAGKSL